MKRSVLALSGILFLISCNNTPTGGGTAAEDTLMQAKDNLTLTAKDESPRRAAIDTLSREEALFILRDIFEAYKDNEEGIDSEDNKNAVTQSLQSLSTVSRPEDLELLINIWAYYDPTDYSCKELVLDVLLGNKTASIAAVRHRMEHPESWETGETDFKYLLEALESKK